MKSVGIQYLEAYRRLKKAGKKNFKRTVYFLFAADEEIGGPVMEKFVKTKEFEELNVGFNLDEGEASENDVYSISYGEKNPWWMQVKISGSPGHGSLFIENDVGTKLKNFLDIVYAFRQEQKEKLENSNGKLTLGDVVTLNVTKIGGGVQVNVVPDQFIIEVDIRIPPAIVSSFENTVKEWMSQAGEGITYTFTQHAITSSTTPITDEDPYWKVFSNTLRDMDCKFKTQIDCGSTDSRFLRAIGIRAIGFSPIINTMDLAHDHNEFLEEKMFLRGVEIYEKLIENLSNIPPEVDA
ncbi:hypothetical protein FO519_009989 [Halicephalobus sp. NKZ332]|nr:hypothetical protein FO519_009989 [Halicephalobus sp. NKZ332]